MGLLDPNPPLTHRFGVFFFAGGLVPNPIDIRFQKVSGLSVNVETFTVQEGGQNLYTQKLPKKVNYDNLVLERGKATLTPLAIEFNVAMSLFKFYPSNVVITLFSENYLPGTTWLFLKAYPVKWSFSSLDANANEVLIETMELAFQDFKMI